MLPGVRWVHPRWLSSLSCTLGVVGFIFGRWHHSSAPWGRWVHPGSFGSLGCALCFVGFILGRLIHSSAPWESLGSSWVAGFSRVRPGRSLECLLGVVVFIRGRWVHSRTPWGSLGSSGVVSFTHVCPLGRWVYPTSLGSLMCALWVFGFVRGHSLPCALNVAVIIHGV